MAVIGAVLGDIAGSQFEFNRPESGLQTLRVIYKQMLLY